MSLQKPPSKSEPSRSFARFLVLLILIAGVVVAVWSAVVNQRIDQVENVPASSIELVDAIDVDGRRINVVADTGGPIPVVLLHDFDIAGSALLDNVAANVGGRFHAIRIDLPGYGLSDRLPEEGTEHTVASIAGVVGAVIEERFRIAVVVVGVGLGGEVAAEVAATNPGVVRGLVLVDVDFWAEDGWEEAVERLPYVGRAATHTLSAGGQLGMQYWAPNCELGGWCPSDAQLEARGVAESISGSTDTLRSHLRTLPSSLVPGDLANIEVPVAYVWSSAGEVPRESVDRVSERLPDMEIFEVGVWKAHLESPGSVFEAIQSVGQR